MSRLLLNNSNAAAAVQRATVGALREPVAATAISKQHISRRWKSLLIHVNKQHKQQQLQRRQISSALTSSSAQTFNARCSNLSSASKYCRALSTSAVDQAKMSGTGKCLQLENINPNFITMEYAVRGPLVIRAGEIEKELKQGVKKPFDYVIRANIGDCHAMGQKPITFLRQLLNLTFDPELIKSPNYPDDVKARAKTVLEGCQGGSVGSYTDSAGIEVIRRQVAEFIAARDGVPCDWRNIFLTAGASPGIKSVLSLLRCKVGGKAPGIMVPIPQYPLYSATIAEYGMTKVDYYLEEETGWSLSTKELQRSYDEAKKTCNPRAIVVINPGNPTGQVLTRQNIEEIIKFAQKNKLFILADEVYQDNIYDKDSKFFSFKKVLTEMGPPYSEMELASFMSTSKGYLGECGIRGGYMEIINMCPQVMAMLTKSITASLCGTTAGQVAVSALVNPPKPGEPSHKKYLEERNGILGALKERAELVHKTLSSFEGYKVNKVQGAMYVFPQVEIPPKAIEAAKAKNMAADVFYATQLLESTGICIVAGTGFGQKPGTYHYRSTILPQTDVLKDMMNKFQKFHAEFMKQYK
ncbi:alanine aminotransferase 1 [Stomoxys calcitrans]|uniref:alanine aminotransferase 1 n=1 Tax=Stomoxys calcitrans TaxID=35570 RepID=UPI0027E32BBA|nr:alanine aminotransferase 1 [Stomoxys calcitrans]XP_059223476.1 alanine aminotransferase 1 [Stomoxys calcitrans]